MDPITVEVFKLALTAGVGFIAGRIQTRFADRVTRTKELQGKVVDCIRTVCTDAVEYHADMLEKKEKTLKAVMLKVDLERIGTDIIQLRKLSKSKNTKLFLQEYVLFFDSVTKYPFEPEEFICASEKQRLVSISVAGEQLVTSVRLLEPNVF